MAVHRGSFLTLAVLALAIPAAVATRPGADAQGTRAPRPAPPAARAEAIVRLGLPGRVNEHVSVDAAAGLLAVAFAAQTAAGGHEIYLAASRDGGRQFTAPLRISAAGARVRVNGEQPPRVRVVPRGGAAEIVAVWVEGGEAGSRLVSARSTDAGRTVGPVTLVPGGEAAGNRGWASTAVTRGGRVLAAWLDHRETVAAASTPGAAAHHHGAAAGSAAAGSTTADDAVQRAQRSRIYVASTDGEVPARAVAAGVCYCCKTALIARGRGEVIAAWRHVFAGNMRDIAFASSADGGRTFTQPSRVSEDHWQLDGCPENGPALAAADDGPVHVVWPTLLPAEGSTGVRSAAASREPVLALFHATARVGHGFSARTRVPTAGTPYHPETAVAPDGSLYAAWEEAGSGPRRVRVARARPVSGTGWRFEPVTGLGGADGVYPRVTTTSTHLVVAWTTRGDGASSIGVRRVAY